MPNWYLFTTHTNLIITFLVRKGQVIFKGRIEVELVVLTKPYGCKNGSCK